MLATDKPSTPYDDVLYPTGLFPQTHPDRLATTAYLRGMSPAPIEHCRVLELGCGAASNLVSMAFQLPESEFVGIDLGRIPIASGRALVADLGLANVTLKAMDLCDPSLEGFLGSSAGARAHPPDLPRYAQPAGGRLYQLQRVPRLPFPGLGPSHDVFSHPEI